MKYFKHLVLLMLSVVMLDADTSTRTSLTFSSDKDGNLNPTLFIPVYYGEQNQFFSGIGYTSSNYNDAGSIDGFNDSKNALIGSSKDILISYINYKDSLFGFAISVGVESTFSQQQNDEFGYIHDSDNVFGNGADYYISFDNSIELDIQRHALRADIALPYGEYFRSRLSTSISPFTSIGVKQSTIFKPLVSETGTSSSKTTQDIAYNFVYELQTKTGYLFDIGALASYDVQPLKYDLAQLAKSGSSFIFNTNTVDTTEIKSLYIVKLIYNGKIMGTLNPSIGYGVEKLIRKDNLSNEQSSYDTTLFTFGFEKRF